MADVGVSNPAAQASFCATLVDEWMRRGVRHAVIAPGSRNTPVALAIAERAELRVHVVHDERSAAFVALGLALDGLPAIVSCTSGTATANLHPAVVEAGLSAIPMLLVTADRPPELRDVGAPQTIDQTHLYGRSVRWFHDPGIADSAASGTWRSLARRALGAAVGAHHGAQAAGPVHLNLPFREPLLPPGEPVPPPDPLPDPLATPSHRSPPSHQSSNSYSAHRADADADADLAALARQIDRQRGVIVAGGRSGVDPGAVAALAAATGWPVLADPTSGARGLDAAITTFDALLRHDRFAADHAPELVIRIGRPPASKVLATWCATNAPVLVQIGGPGAVDPDHGVGYTLAGDDDLVAGLATHLTGATNTTWAARWRTAESRAQAAIASALADEATLSEAGAARSVADWLPDDADLVVASSMPVRDLEWYGGPRARAHANRGANGIDGTLSTAVGRALTGRTVAVLIGDVAFLHDSNALVGIAERDVDVRIVVVDNDGGGIFSFLPQASALPAERFEQLFGTPHGTNLLALAAAHGVTTGTATTHTDLLAAIDQRGPSVIRVPSDRARNLAAHAELIEIIHAAL